MHGQLFNRSTLQTEVLRVLFAIVSLASFVACTPIPTYRPPEGMTESAHIKLVFEDESIIAGTASVRKVNGEIVCGQPFKTEKLIIVTKGFAIGSLNPDGVNIPAEKITLFIMGINDGLRPCGNVFSFVPKVGGRYEIGVANRVPRTEEHHQPIQCPFEIHQIQGDGDGIATPIDITYDKCVAEEKSLHTESTPQ